MGIALETTYRQFLNCANGWNGFYSTNFLQIQNVSNRFDFNGSQLEEFDEYFKGLGGANAEAYIIADSPELRRVLQFSPRSKLSPGWCYAWEPGGEQLRASSFKELFVAICAEMNQFNEILSTLK